MKARILSIDAWRYDGSWSWNNWFRHHTEIEIPDDITNRQLLRMARDEWGILSDESKGRVTVEDDGYNLVILDRKTLEPLYAVEYWSFQE